jgi:peptidoglycan DL-endopeptidase CwlO
MGFAQDKKIDRIEMFYDQAYYGKVLKKARKLQALPEYDFSALPAFYEAMAIFRLADDRHWRKRHEGWLDEAVAAYRNFLDSDKAEDYIKAHFFEIAEQKTYLKELEFQLIDEERREMANKLNSFLEKEMKGIEPLLPIQIEEQEAIATDGTATSSSREKIVKYATTFIGVKYVWAGSDEKGFDCSGFTTYVYKKFGILLPRTANGQKDMAKKVKIKDASKGDLVFFGPGVKITHVGLVVSAKGEELSMVHASSSKGVIITNIVSSTYWSPKLKAAGSYL